MTLLEFVNRMFVQFLFIRICHNTKGRYGILYWVKPLSGWGNDFVYISKSNKGIVFWL